MSIAPKLARPVPATAVAPQVEFCGIHTVVDRTPFTIGRDGDLVLDDDNRHLHRNFLVLDRYDQWWTLANVGTQLSASVSQGGRVEAHLQPGGVLVLVAPTSTVRFSAGPTSYELAVHVPVTRLSVPTFSPAADADATVGRVALSPEQLMLVAVLAEPVLRGGHLAASSLPSNVAAARRLGWTITKFNRKLDAVCTKLADRGVRGLHGGPTRLATNRRARLVEYAVGAQLVTSSDVALLPEPR